MNRPLSRFPKIPHFHVRGRMTLILIAFDLNSLHSRFQSAFDIAGPIADHDAVLPVDGKVLSRLLDQGSSGFSAAADHGIFEHRTLGMVRAVVNAVERKSKLILQAFLQFRVEMIDILGRVITTGDACLIGDDDKKKAMIVEEFEGFRHTGEDFKILDAIDITCVTNENAVTIQKSSRSTDYFFVHKARVDPFPALQTGPIA